MIPPCFDGSTSRVPSCSFLVPSLLATSSCFLIVCWFIISQNRCLFQNNRVILPFFKSYVEKVEIKHGFLELFPFNQPNSSIFEWSYWPCWALWALRPSLVFRHDQMKDCRSHMDKDMCTYIDRDIYIYTRMLYIYYIYTYLYRYII